jgi:hypothetical protein
MKPSVKITDEAKDGMHLCIRLDDILSALTAAQRIELVRQAALDEVVVKDIVDQLAHGWTDDGSCIWDKVLTELRVKLLPLMGEVAKEAIRDLVQERDNAKLDAKRCSAWAWSMREQWPREYQHLVPPIPDFGYAPKMADEEARKIAGVEAPKDGE